MDFNNQNKLKKKSNLLSLLCPDEVSDWKTIFEDMKDNLSSIYVGED